MTTDYSEEIYLAAQAGGCLAVAQLRQLIYRLATKYRATRSPDFAFFSGRAYYEMPTSFPRRVRQIRIWLERSLVGRPEDIFSHFLLGCTSLDERQFSSASTAFEKIGLGAFSTLDPHWQWRDIKVLELRCASALRTSDGPRVHQALAAYSEALATADENDVPAPHELVAALSESSCLQDMPDLAKVIKYHTDINWGTALEEKLARFGPGNK